MIIQDNGQDNGQDDGQDDVVNLPVGARVVGRRSAVLGGLLVRARRAVRAAVQVEHTSGSPPPRVESACVVFQLLQSKHISLFQSFVVNAGRGSVGEESTQPVTYSVHGQTWLHHALCISAGNLITEPSK